MGELVELDVTTVEESVTVNVTEEGQVQVAVFAEKGDTGPAGPAGPNTITTSTTTNLTGFISGNGTAITGATAGATAATPNTLVLRNDDGGGVAFTGGGGTGVDIFSNSGTGANIISESGKGVEIFSNSGTGADISSYSETAALISSEIGTGANISSSSGTYHAQFGDSEINRSFVARVAGAFGWFRGAFTGRIQATDVLTDNRTYTLPDRSGNVALTEDYTAGTATIDVLNATVQGTLTADHIHGNLAGSVYAHIRAGENLAKGDPVYVSGSHGSGATLIPVVSKADASNAAKMPAVGVMDAAVASQSNGHMVITGTITELDTNAYPVNTVLYVAAGGGWTSTPPAANSQAVAIVERSNTNNGAVIVKVNGLASSGSNGAADANKLVRYNSTGGASLTGGTLTDMTYAGTAAFTSTTRPTSAGTGTPAATSLITRADGDARYGELYVTRLTSAVSYTNDATGTTVLSLTLPSGVYQIDAFLRFSANAANSRIVMGSTDGSTALLTGYRGTYNNGAAPARVAGANTNLSGGGPWGATANTDNHERGSVLSLTNQTTISFIASQNTSSGTTTTLAAGAYFIAKKIA